MKIASTGIWLLWMVVDNASQGVKFSRKLGNGNTLWVTTKRKG